MCDRSADAESNDVQCSSDSAWNNRTQCMNQWASEVAVFLGKAETVILAGHSHGAVVVNVIAKTLTTSGQDLSRLHIVTSASTYIPPALDLERTAHAAHIVQHFMSLGDKAVRCNPNLLARARDLIVQVAVALPAI